MVGLKAKLFGSSGVRGVVNTDLTPALALEIGLATATHSKAGKILVARDTRVSGLMLENALVAGLLAGGVDVDCVGVVPTPVLAWLTQRTRATTGIMLTASHNPPKYNGIKIFHGNSVAYGETDQNRIETIVQNESFKLADWLKIGKALSTNQTHLYENMILEKIQLNKQWHVAVDPGCGATHHLAPMILKNLGCKVTAINAQPDGFFPARNSEPSKESLQSLAKIVRELGADLGVAYDGDGDRVAFIDEKGNFVDFDRCLAAYAAHAVNEKQGGVIVTNVEASMCVEKMVEKKRGEVIRVKVGDIYVSHEMRDHDSVFGGEPCGAWIHPRFHYCPDGVLSSALLLKALEEKEITTSEFVSQVPQYPTLRENIPCGNEVKHKLVSKIGDNLKTLFPRYKDFSTIDGVRLTLENGWILIRASGTEPLMRLTVEGESLRAAKQIMRESIRLVRRIIKEKT